jgi:hypothetical protein
MSGYRYRYDSPPHRALFKFVGYYSGIRKLWDIRCMAAGEQSRQNFCLTSTTKNSRAVRGLFLAGGCAGDAVQRTAAIGNRLGPHLSLGKL